MMRLSICLVAGSFVLLMSAAPLFAQDPTPSPSPSPAPAPVVSDDAHDDAVLNPAEPDFTLIGLPTSLRLPQNKSWFRVTHRFTRPLKCDTCANSLAGDGFGIDTGAQIGLEYWYGIAPSLRIGIDRTSDKTVSLSGQYGFARQGAHSPIEASALVAVDVSNVGRRDTDSQYAPTLGVILTRMFGRDAAIYVEPMWVHNTNQFQPAISDNDTVMIGLGARARIRPTVYVVAEFSPRVSGYKPGTNQGSFAIEKRAGGHVFQLNFSNSFASQLSQIAQGAANSSDWYMGFNLTRKFY